ncbi:response regulator transcription factor [Phytoactinopolyspora limicola]|uniref:response regulator transcription factor n=1 Tax=Phytoactinopolyspora limicola TaxID=2715536 RepID=UPI0014075198|nr:response regulator transcription factor [Phytoactinopolyspora limicola]
MTTTRRRGIFTPRLIRVEKGNVITVTPSFRRPSSPRDRSRKAQTTVQETTIKVLIAEDMHMIRGALVALLRTEADFEVVAEVDRGDEVEQAALRAQPDVALLDIDLPVQDGLSAAESLAQSLPSCRVVILTGLSQPSHLLRALQAGIHGFLMKDAPADTLARTIRRVRSGERVIDPDLLSLALQTGASPLTSREADVLRMATSGSTTEEIAVDLSLSPATVRNYMSSAISKLGGRNRIDAIRIATDAGWL